MMMMMIFKSSRISLSQCGLQYNVSSKFARHICRRSMGQKSWANKDWTRATRGNVKPGDVIKVHHAGWDVLQNSIFNKGVAFPYAERDRLGLRGLLPPRLDCLEGQTARVKKRLRDLPSDLVKFESLMSLQDRNETLFYRILVDNLKEFAPIIYTPTVGLAAQNFGDLYRRPRGMYFSSRDQGDMKSMVYNWPRDDVQIAVITDGSRILGLGDLGINGMAIPIGKLSLYTAIAGIHPARTLPIVLDVGTNNSKLRESPMYLGIRQPRMLGAAYYRVLDECISALKTRWPNMLLQFEDFDNHTAIPVLQRYCDELLCFNDDIQGTGAVTVAGLFGALRSIGFDNADALCQQHIVIVGAGTAGIGIADAIVYAMCQRGATRNNALANVVLVDAKGALGKERCNFSVAQKEFLSSEVDDGDSLVDVITKIRPSILIAVSGVAGIFSEDVVRKMASIQKHPIIFPLSNPTSNAECSAEQAFQWSDGRAVFASGSPFDDVTLKNGKTCFPNQANNMYTFPGIGLGALICEAKLVSKQMLYASSVALSNSVSAERLAKGLIFPDLDDIRDITKDIAVQVCLTAQQQDLGRSALPQNEEIVRSVIDHEQWDPNYGTLVLKRD